MRVSTQTGWHVPTSNDIVALAEHYGGTDCWSSSPNMCSPAGTQIRSILGITNNEMRNGQGSWSGWGHYFLNASYADPYTGSNGRTLRTVTNITGVDWGYSAPYNGIQLHCIKDLL